MLLQGLQKWCCGISMIDPTTRGLTMTVCFKKDHGAEGPHSFSFTRLAQALC